MKQTNPSVCILRTFIIIPNPDCSDQSLLKECDSDCVAATVCEGNQPHVGIKAGYVHSI